MPAQKPDFSGPKGIRWPKDLLEKVDSLSKKLENTRSGTVIYLCRKGLETLKQEEKDRLRGRELRITTPWRGVERRVGERRKLGS